MANEQNLLKGDERHKFTPEEHSKGGIASGKARREKADLKKMMQLWLDTEVAKDKDGNVLTGAELMVLTAAKEMRKGSSKFWELIRDTAGYKPIEKVMVSDVEQSVIDEVERVVEYERLKDGQTTGN